VIAVIARDRRHRVSFVVQTVWLITQSTRAFDLPMTAMSALTRDDGDPPSLFTFFSYTARCFCALPQLY